MRVFLIEDEVLAADKLRELVGLYLQDATIVGHARKVSEALAWLRSNDMPDLIFSDIELLDGKVFSLYEQFPVDCPIVFTTAYDQYLLEAFQTSGIAYLLKPFDDQDFQSAVSKYQRLFSKPNVESQLTPDLVQQLKDALQPTFRQYKQRFTVKKSNGIFLLATEDILFISADGNLVLAHDQKGKRHPINYKLSQLEELLDPSNFFRISRSEILSLKAIEKIETYFNDRLAVNIKGQKEAVIVSASRVPSFRKWLER